MTDMITIVADDDFFAQERDTLPGIYAHGEAEKILGYDIIATAKKDQCLPDGVTCVTLRRSDSAETEYPALAFVWTVGRQMKRGYVVSSTDAGSIEFAARQYALRPEIL